MELQIVPGAATAGFFRLRAADQDSDGDGIDDWEESAIGFDPARTRPERNAQLDAARVLAGLVAAHTITVSVYDDTYSERWPDPGVIAVRRTGGWQPLTVNVSFTGTATRGADYNATTAGNVVTFGPGQREAFVEINPLTDAADGEATETITLTVLAGAGHAVGGPNAGTVSLLHETATTGPSPKEAARFLIQAAFGPDQDAYAVYSAATAGTLPGNITFPNTLLGRQLRQGALALMGRIALGAVRQTFFVNRGGWDHHSDTLALQFGMLGEVDAAVSAFWQQLVALGIENQITLFCASDFGRTLTSNDQGSDHAWGGNHFGVGGSVVGRKIYGSYPSLTVNPDSGAEVNPLDTGRGQLNDRSAHTGVAVGGLVVLQQEFANAGKSAEDIGPVFGKMAKTLQGGSANNTIKKLGINPEELKKKTPAEQLRTLVAPLNTTGRA